MSDEKHSESNGRDYLNHWGVTRFGNSLADLRTDLVHVPCNMELQPKETDTHLGLYCERCKKMVMKTSEIRTMTASEQYHPVPPK